MLSVLFCQRRTSSLSERAERGQSVAELALLLPLLILLLALLFDVGRAFNAYMVVTNAAREGARYGSQNPTHTSEIVQRARYEATRGGLVGSNLTVTVTSGSAGQPIIVRAQYPFPTILGSVLRLPTIPLSSQFRMLIYG